MKNKIFYDLISGKSAKRLATVVLCASTKPNQPFCVQNIWIVVNVRTQRLKHTEPNTEHV